MNTTIPEELRKEASNALYTLLQAALNEKPLLQLIGYDLGNDMMNIPLRYLREKHKLAFEELVDNVSGGSTSLHLINFLLRDKLPINEEQLQALERFMYLRAIQKGEEARMAELKKETPGESEVQNTTT